MKKCQNGNSIGLGSIPHHYYLIINKNSSEAVDCFTTTTNNNNNSNNRLAKVQIDKLQRNSNLTTQSRSITKSKPSSFLSSSCSQNPPQNRTKRKSSLQLALLSSLLLLKGTPYPVVGIITIRKVTTFHRPSTSLLFHSPFVSKRQLSSSINSRSTSGWNVRPSPLTHQDTSITPTISYHTSRSLMTSIPRHLLPDPNCGDGGNGISSMAQHKSPSSPSSATASTNMMTTASTSWEGNLIARILPKQYEEYNTRKPSTRWLDPKPLLQALKTAKGASSTKTTTSYSRATTDCIVRDTDYREEECTVSLDLNLRSLLQQQGQEHADSTNTSRDSSSGVNDIKKICVHLNRKADESAHRTLQRLELSTENKIRSAFPILKGKGKRPRKKKKMDKQEGNGGKSNGQSQHQSQQQLKPTNDRSRIFFLLQNNISSSSSESEPNTSIEQEMNFQNNTSSAHLWKEIAVKVKPQTFNQNQYTAQIALHRPNQNTNQNSTTNDITNSQIIPITITSCPPTILSIQTFEHFESKVYTSVPLVIRTELIYASRAIVSWFLDGTLVCHDSHSFTPLAPHHVGKSLSVLIVPVRDDHGGGDDDDDDDWVKEYGCHDGTGCEEAYSFQHVVERLPFMPIVSPIRDGWRPRTPTPHEEIQQSSSPQSQPSPLRVMTYNILADLYASREMDRQVIFQHCEQQFLGRRRRMPMIVAEILAYDADIICLQEVDGLIYDTLLEPVLESRGFRGFYSNKVSSQREGCAMFWSESLFTVETEEVDLKTFSVRDLFVFDHPHLDTDGPTHVNHEFHSKENRSLERWESMDNILALLEEHTDLKEVVMEKIGQVLQVATLTLRDTHRHPHMPEKIVVANTHLFYHPMADHVRAMQAFVICKKIDEIRRCHRPTLSPTATSGIASDTATATAPLPIILCGDLNSCVLSGVVQLLFHRSLLPEDGDCWEHLNIYRWEMGDCEYMMEHGMTGNATMESGNDSSLTSPTSASPSSSLTPAYSKSTSNGKIGDDSQHSRSTTNKDSNANNVVQPPPIILPKSFPNLISGCWRLPQFTNYAIGFVETLDYVLASEPSETEPFGFGLKRSAPMPSEEDVKCYIAMPNEFMPSDHVSVACDLEWKLSANDDNA